MPRGKYNRSKTDPEAERTPQPTGLTKFDVMMENNSGELIAVFHVVAQTKSEAINRAKQQLVFTAERAK